MPRSAKVLGSRTTLGVISDTHGLVRPEALAALRGCDALVHAGDVGKPEVLEELRRLAPLTAIRGNVADCGDGEVRARRQHGEMLLRHPAAAHDADPLGGHDDADSAGGSRR